MHQRLKVGGEYKGLKIKRHTNKSTSVVSAESEAEMGWKVERDQTSGVTLMSLMIFLAQKDYCLSLE